MTNDSVNDVNKFKEICDGFKKVQYNLLNIKIIKTQK